MAAFKNDVSERMQKPWCELSDFVSTGCTTTRQDTRRRAGDCGNNRFSHTGKQEALSPSIFRIPKCQRKQPDKIPAAYKLHVIKEAERYLLHGDIGALLRPEGRFLQPDQQPGAVSTKKPSWMSLTPKKRGCKEFPRPRLEF